MSSRKVYVAVKYIFKKLIGTSKLPPYHICYTVGNRHIKYNTYDRICSICKLVLPFL